MNHRNFRKPFAIAVGAAIAGTLAAASVANANPFSLTSLGNAYMAATEVPGGTDKAKEEGKCGEGKCGADKAKEEGKCGADKAKEEGKCGEGKCGANKMKEGEKKEGEKA
jgi:uncharacterized low-complexity protein